MLSRRPTAPANDAIASVPVFTPDPHGAALFAGSLSGGLGGGRAVIDSRVSQAWHGTTQSPQSFRGAGLVGGGRPVVRQGSTLDRERGQVTDSVQAIFEQRAGARRFG